MTDSSPSRKRPRPPVNIVSSSHPLESQSQPRPYHHGIPSPAITRSESAADIATVATDITDISVSNASDFDAPRTSTKEAGQSSSKSTLSPKDEMQDVMQDNLDLMLDIVMRIREDPEFASGIYKECPRLQHMLDQHPNLRPLFEDPKLVRINFEEVYKKAGGVLPEDKKPKTMLQRIVQSPFFKVLKVLLFCKKIMTCVMGGGLALTGAIFSGFFAPEDGAGDHDANDPDADMDSNNRENREALDRAADRMEDKETQERMHHICEEHDPQKLLEEIEDNPDLKALRDSNPLCAELMSDPETMKILVDPDNLRSLGDAAEMIEQDFADSSWSPPDIQAEFDMPELEGDHPVHGETSSSMVPDDSMAPEQPYVDDSLGTPELDTDNAVNTEGTDAQQEHMVEEETELGDEAGDEDGEGGEEEGGEEEEEEGMEYEHGEADTKGNSQSASKGASKKPPPKQKAKNAQGGGAGGFLGNIRAGITDMVAAELVGVSVSEMTSSEMEDLEAMEEAADEAGDTAEDMEDAAMALDSAAEIIDNHGDAFDGLEDGMDGAEDAHDEAQDDRARKAKMAGVAAAGGAAAVGAGTVVSRRKKRGDVEEGEFEEDDEKPAGRFGFFKNMAASISTAAKEHVASSFLGDDMGELLVEKVEEEDEESSDEDFSDEEDEDSDGSKDGQEDVEKGK